MNIESDIVSGWFVSSAGKVYGRCPSCHSPNIAYHKTRTPGLRGISAFSKGITPACMDCGKSMPTLKKNEQKPRTIGKGQKRPFSK